MPELHLIYFEDLDGQSVALDDDCSFRIETEDNCTLLGQFAHVVSEDETTLPMGSGVADCEDPIDRFSFDLIKVSD